MPFLITIRSGRYFHKNSISPVFVPSRGVYSLLCLVSSCAVDLEIAEVSFMMMMIHSCEKISNRTAMTNFEITAEEIADSDKEIGLWKLRTVPLPKTVDPLMEWKLWRSPQSWWNATLHSGKKHQASEGVCGAKPHDFFIFFFIFFL